MTLHYTRFLHYFLTSVDLFRQKAKMGKDQVSDAFRDCVVRRLQYEQAEARYGGAVPLPINNNVKQVETQLFNTAFNDG